MPRENRVEKSRVHSSCQAQYLVKLECDFSWQAQHLVTISMKTHMFNLFAKLSRKNNTNTTTHGTAS